MTAKGLSALCKEWATNYGFSEKSNAIWRENLVGDDDNKCPFFAIIRPEQPVSGPYSDFSWVIFPLEKEGIMQQAVVGLVVGSFGFQSDLEAAQLPGWRRDFMRLKNGEKTVFKSDFADIESTLEPLLSGDLLRVELKSRLEKYKTVLSAVEVVNFDNFEEAHRRIQLWLSTYASLRNWGGKSVAAVRNRILRAISTTEQIDYVREVKTLLLKHHYVILQGAPGTGKTYTALAVAQELAAKQFFIQFHAETTYADFIYGLQPRTDSVQLLFEPRKGVLLQAVDYAKANPSQTVVLIIDEINRANLPNVLGPVFYLFEQDDSTHSVVLTIGNEEISRIPDNLLVIGTMNTADRSLAVVDFALRRRFLWYTLRPQPFSGANFRLEAFEQMSQIFRQYACDTELSLQPGPSYFVASEDDFEQRARFELMPLIKEYLAEGYMPKAKDAFCAYFQQYAKADLYE